MSRWALLVIALAGCDAVLGFELPAVADAGDAGDAGDALPPGCWGAALADDEDGDARPDGCDLCPADPEGAPSNDDGDGMNDPCDPDPDSQQQLVAFDGFARPGTWQPTTPGTWSVANGSYLQTEVTDASTAWSIPPTSRVGIDALFTGLTGASGTGAEVWVTMGAAGTKVQCGFQHRGAPTPDRVVLHVNGGEVGFADLDGSGAVRVRLHLGPDGQAFCTGRRGGGQVMLMSAPGGDAVSTLIGLATDASIAEFLSVTVFSTP